MLAILVLTLVHFAAFGLLFWHLAGSEIFSVFRIPGDEGGRGGPEAAPEPDPRPDPDGGVPLPDAGRAPVRLREQGRIADAYPRRTRRPDHVPGTPERTPV